MRDGLLEDGELRMEDGELRMEDGELKMAESSTITNK